MNRRSVSWVVGIAMLACLMTVVVILLYLLQPQGIALASIGRGAVAIVRIEGTIMDPAEPTRQLRLYTKSPAVRAILIRIESPGGAVGASQEIHREILRARRDGGKKVVASMGNVAASGGYYVACAADEIFANAGTVTGSIGVVLETYDLQGISKKIGFGVNTIKSGQMKDVGSPFREMTPEERQVLQTTIDDTYDQFLEAVIEGRRAALARAWRNHTEKPTTSSRAADRPTTAPAQAADTASTSPTREALKDFLRSFADGRILSGRQALDLGLVDRLGGLQDATDRAAELGGIRGKPTILQERRKSSLWDLLRGRNDAVSRLVSPNGFALQYRLVFD
ncbi:MAG: signal peptide peptidase SppA [Candidatus Sumerlaeia bacterium]|nr:signal peptide peptidase SppA [Candidatus Sumerlaeia bacterium]